MASYSKVTALTYGAGENLGTDRYWHILKQIAAGTVALADNASGSQTSIAGIAWSKAASGAAIAVAVKGEAAVVAGAAISAGVRLTCNASGRAVAASSGQWTLGVAQESCQFDGEKIRVLLQIPSVRLSY